MEFRDRIRELRRVRASDLIPNAKNYRKHPEAQKNALTAILADVGYADALLVRENEAGGLELIDGHLRAETTPDQIVPVLVLDVTAEEAEKILITHDPLSAMAETDQVKLQSLRDQVRFDDPAVVAMLDKLKGELKGASPVVEDDVPEPPKDAITKPGDVWMLGEHRLCCGDCRDAETTDHLLAGSLINVAMTSPPYASQRKYDASSGFTPIAPDDYVAWWEPLQQIVAPRLAADGSFFVNIKPHCEDGERVLYVFDLVLAMQRQWGWRFVDEFCWRDTKNGVPGGWNNRFKDAFEPVYHFARGAPKFRPEAVSTASEACFDYSAETGVSSNGSKLKSGDPAGGLRTGLARPSNVIELPAADGRDGHSAAFPVGLPSFFLRAFSDPGDVIYEPFAGSGTTLIAAEQLGRRCYAMEISPAYCDIVVARWEKLTGRKAQLER